ncbi:MAG: vWA domain-containing protein [Acidimicrobiales bacterium]
MRRHSVGISPLQMGEDVNQKADLAALVGSLGAMLRHYGAPVSVDQLSRCARALDTAWPTTSEELYWIGRVTLVSDRGSIEIYESVFDQVFRGLLDWADTRGDPNAPPPHERPVRDSTDQHSQRAPGVASTGQPHAGPDRNGSASEQEPEREIEVAVASRAERLATTDFADLDDDELRELRSLMRAIRISIPLRPSRRHYRHRHGDRLDLRATLHASRRSAGDPVLQITTSPGRRPRKVVVLCDISGSMAPYSRACIQLLHAAAGSSRAEVFTFATRLTRLTRALSVANADTALSLAASAAPDWNSGTRIGASLKEFIDRYGRGGLARGAVVVIVSDGWDREEPALVAEQMARLSRLAHRIVWINPRRAAPGFAPLAGGMAAALPHCDALVSGNTLSSLQAVMGALGDCSS